MPKPFTDYIKQLKTLSYHIQETDPLTFNYIDHTLQQLEVQTSVPIPAELKECLIPQHTRDQATKDYAMTNQSGVMGLCYAGQMVENQMSRQFQDGQIVKPTDQIPLTPMINTQSGAVYDQVNGNKGSFDHL